MNKGTVVLLVILALFLWIAASIMNWMVGPDPVFRWAEIVTRILFGVSCVFAIGFSLTEWRRARIEMKESEEEFLREAESGLPGEPRVLTESVVFEGGPVDSAPMGVGVADGPVVGLGVAPPESSASPVPRAGAGGREESALGSVVGSPGVLGVAPDAGSGVAPEGASPSLEKLAEDLRRLGILKAYEGKVELPPPASPGLIYGLREGGLALLLEEMESHRFLAYQARRFRAIIVRGPEGKPLVVQRYEDFVTKEMPAPRG